MDNSVDKWVAVHIFVQKLSVFMQICCINVNYVKRGQYLVKVNSTKLYAVLLALLIVSQLICMAVLYADSYSSVDLGYTFVIDAGHGGIDGGVTGVSGSVESVLTLQYALELGELLEYRNFGVVYTRTTYSGLYGLPTSGFKRRDMEARRDIILDADADIVISIHMNWYSDSSRCGAQVFYQEGYDSALADSVQNSINSLTGKSYSALAGDYYICNCTDVSSIIVECGFLSNSEEEQLLLTDSYRQQLMYAVMCGVLGYMYSL